MKPFSIQSLVLVSTLFTPVLHAQNTSAKVHEIEQKVLLKNYQNAVHALVGSARDAGENDASAELLGKRMQWLAMVDAQIDADGKTAATNQEDMTESAVTLNKLAWRMITSPDAGNRDPEIALKLATIAIELARGNEDLKSNVLDTKARALFLLGKKDEAIAEQEKALAAATMADQKAKFETTLAGYRRGELPEVSAKAAETTSGMAHISEKLSRIIIPRIDFEDTTVEEAINFLRLRAAELDITELDPTKKGVNLVIRRPRPVAAGASDAGKVPATLGAEAGLPDTANDPGALRVKELRLRNVPLGVALKYICEQTKLHYKMDDFAITFLSESDAAKETFPSRFKVPSDFGSSLVSTQEFLKLCGINFGEGASAKLSSPGELLVVNTLPELDKIEQLIPQNRINKLEQWSEVDQEKTAASAGVSYLAEKLKTIVIPAIDFNDTSVEEAVDFLRMRAKELDTAELDPSRKGVNFVIRRPRPAAARAADAGKAPTTPGEESGLPDVVGDPGALRITELRLRNVPLAVVLKYICDQTKLGYKVDDLAVTLFSQNDLNQAIFTRSFRVPSNFASPLVPIQKLLESNGINFPAGTSVVMGSSGVLLVTNTPSELDRIEQLISAVVDNTGKGKKETPAPPVAVPAIPVPAAREELFNRTFRVPTDFASMLDSGSAAGTQTARPPTMELLKSAGIHFPEGSSVTLSSSGVMMVINTPSELYKIEILIMTMVNYGGQAKKKPLVQPVPVPANPVPSERRDH